VKGLSELPVVKSFFAYDSRLELLWSELPATLTHFQLMTKAIKGRDAHNAQVRAKGLIPDRAPRLAVLLKLASAFALRAAAEGGSVARAGTRIVALRGASTVRPLDVQVTILVSWILAPVRGNLIVRSTRDRIIAAALIASLFLRAIVCNNAPAVFQ
jgi:hypothetical protein